MSNAAEIDHHLRRALMSVLCGKLLAVLSFGRRIESIIVADHPSLKSAPVDFGPGGFASARDIAAITVNRWPHGYGYVENSLFDGADYDKTVALARQKVGRVAIANSDAGGDTYAHLAIDQAARAVRELVE